MTTVKHGRGYAVIRSSDSIGHSSALMLLTLVHLRNLYTGAVLNRATVQKRHLADLYVLLTY